MPNLPNHRQHLSPFVLSLSKQERTLCLSKKLFNQLPSTNSRQESSWPFQSLPFDVLPSSSSGRSKANG
ncbi:MAG: hypothetical protein LBD67_01925 [Candidatus Accumulibacter sp.]|nr:hypothetical protein [Accumulibacter sp.]